MQSTTGWTQASGCESNTPEVQVLSIKVRQTGGGTLTTSVMFGGLFGFLFGVTSVILARRRKIEDQEVNSLLEDV